MLKHLTFIILSLYFSSTIGFTQTLDNARQLFIQEKYEEAKPIFERFLKVSPNVANYNYWYGVCAFETREYDKAVQPLLFAHKRNVSDATLYLARTYNKLYDFDKAETLLENQIKLDKRRRKNTTKLEELLTTTKYGSRMLRGVEQVIVIDSIVVNKFDFLDAISLSPEAGSLDLLIPFTKDSLEFRPTIFTSERGNVRFFAKKDTAGYYQLYQQNLIGNNNWNKTEPLNGLVNDSINLNYPYMLSDGVTLYFASDNPQTSLGEYDIMVTRFNPDNNIFLKPENLGMPFNSIYNDYLYIIDEYNDLGWFVSDRFQPKEKVCIYIFIPNKIKRTYNSEAIPADKLKSLALLKDIKQTWTDKQTVQDALARLNAIKNLDPEEKKLNGNSFIINDNKTYFSEDDFKSEKARDLFKQYQLLQKDLQKNTDNLDIYRTEYVKSNKKTNHAIIDLEKQIISLRSQLKELEKQIRKEELNKH